MVSYSSLARLDSVAEHKVESANDARELASYLGSLRLQIAEGLLEDVFGKLAARSAGFIGEAELRSTFLSAKMPVFTTMKLLDKAPGAKRWLWNDLVRITGNSTMVLIHGCEKQGKTWLVLAMALSLASGEPLLGNWTPSPKMKKVLLLSPEGGSEIARERLWKLARGLHMPPEVWARADENISYVDMDDCTIHINKPSDMNTLRNTIASTGANVLIFDPLVEFHTADENSNTEMAGMLAGIRCLSDRTLATILCHHNTKNGTTARGASALLGKYDFKMSMDKGSDWKDDKVGGGRSKIIEIKFAARASITPPDQLLVLSSDADDLVINLQIRDKVCNEDAKLKMIKTKIVDVIGNRTLSKTELRRVLPGANHEKSLLLESLITEGFLAADGLGWKVAESTDDDTD